MEVVAIIGRITNSLMSFVVRQEAIDKKDEKELAICHYGIEICIASIVNIMLILALGLLTNTLIDSILFLMVFVPIRQCTGGFHAETYFICNLTMAVTYSAVVLGVFLLPNDLVVALTLWLISFIIIYKYAPCDNKHKRLSVEKKLKFKRFSRIIWIVLLVLVCLLPDSYDRVMMNVVLTMSLISLLIVMDIIIKNIRRTKQWQK